MGPRAQTAIVLLVALGVAAGPARGDPTQVVRRQEHMATWVTVTVAVPETSQVRHAIDEAFAEIARLETVLSEWKPGTDIARINAQAGGKPARVGPDVFHVLRAAHRVSVDSGGAFDVTVGSLWGAWDFRWQTPRIPSAQELAERVARVDYRLVELDSDAQTVRLARKGMKLALGGIAKGYAIDRASAVLRGRGYPNHLIEAGGDVYASGRRGVLKWRVGIRDPRGDFLYGTIEVEDEAIATSGNYERFFIKDGTRYHHLLDPKSGRPARGLASATVRAPRCVLADAYATAVFVAGPRAGLALMQGREDLAAMVMRGGTYEVLGAGGLMARVQVNGPRAR